MNSYYAMAKSVVDADKCIGCGECKTHCAFDAISLEKGVANVNPVDCEGCKVCQYVCPNGAIDMRKTEAGKLMLYNGNGEVFSSARLGMGNGTSGKLVTEVKKQLRENVSDADIAIIDGSPGIGCPVVASLSGVDMVLIVTEPTLSGISDLKRIVNTAKGFRVKIAVAINKCDLNIKKKCEIEEYLKSEKIHLAGEIPYDSVAVKAVNEGKNITEIDSKAGTAIRSLYLDIMPLLMS